MKRSFLFLLMISLFFSCGKKNDILVTRQDDGSIVLSFTADKKYLILPLEEPGLELPVDVKVDGKQEHAFLIRFAGKNIDYRIPMDISAWKGKKVELVVKNGSNADIFCSDIRQSDTFEGNKEEKYRPVYHFTPPYGWMNDPNGLLYYDGNYHLFFQHNPFGSRGQNTSWGHAVSGDLVTWQSLPEAIYPDQFGLIFSGSSVVDWNNTSELQTGKEKTFLALYTQYNAAEKKLHQSLAYSNDKGLSWTKYSGNPILKHRSAPDFRDPKVFWYEPNQEWVMAVACNRVLEIYTSPNAIDWTYESCFGNDYGLPQGGWECLDLFELPLNGDVTNKKWVLICNCTLGGPSGGPVTQYFVGDFDGKKFTCDFKKEEVHLLDWGKDNYATVSWSDIPREDGRRIIIAWMSNWNYANDVPSVSFKGAMTVPKELKLVTRNNKPVLISYPVIEIDKLRRDPKYINTKIEKEYVIDDLYPYGKGAYELDFTIKNITAGIVGLKLINPKNEFTDIFISIPEKRLYVDRTKSGVVDFHATFPAKVHADIEVKDTYKLRILVDRASIECFEGNGETNMTNIVFPELPYNKIIFYAQDGSYDLDMRTYRMAAPEIR
ncbi:MAG: GH32 C-terminal domain-containing protein [Barnesiella sp.]